MSNSTSSEKIERYLELFLLGKKDDLPELTEAESDVVNFFLQRRSVASPKPEFLAQLEAKLTALTPTPKPKLTLSVRPFWRNRHPYYFAALAALFILLLSIGVFSPRLFGLSNKQTVSAQTILTNLAANIESRQKSNQITHRKTKSTYCTNYEYDSVEAMLSSSYRPYLSKEEAAAPNENGFRCTSDISEYWSSPEDSLYLSYDQNGNLSGIGMTYDGWSYGYAGGTTKASKQDEEMIAEVLEREGIFYGIPSSTQPVEIIDEASLGQLSESLSAANAKLQSDQDKTLLKLRDMFGNVVIKGEETIGKHKTWKLAYHYTNMPSEDFNVGYANAILIQPTSGLETVLCDECDETMMTTQEDTSTNADMPTSSPLSGSVSEPEFGEYTTTFWVDQETFEQVRFEESVLINGVKQITYLTEILVDEELPLQSAPEVFRFPLPDGVELIDTTELVIAAQRAEREAANVEVLELLKTSELGIFYPTYIPSPLQLDYVSYYDARINHYAFLDQFLPPIDAEWKDKYQATSVGENIFLSFSEPNLLPTPDQLVEGQTVYEVPPLKFVGLSISNVKPYEYEEAEVVSPLEDPEHVRKVVDLDDRTGILESFPGKEGTTDSYYSLSWEQEGRFFSLSGDGLSEEELIRLAVSVRRLTASDTAILESLQTIFDQASGSVEVQVVPDAEADPDAPKPSETLPEELTIN